mmetsp:Transcript_11901/g.25657  ORF Transcript_11901/g.25657 Transcript_11901/m.25657 type:complete len:337 (-) Transcript_11901:840-1850(-)
MPHMWEVRQPADSLSPGPDHRTPKPPRRRKAAGQPRRRLRQRRTDLRFGGNKEVPLELPSVQSSALDSPLLTAPLQVLRPGLRVLPVRIQVQFQGFHGGHGSTRGGGVVDGRENLRDCGGDLVFKGTPLVLLGGSRRLIGRGSKLLLDPACLSHQALLQVLSHINHLHLEVAFQQLLLLDVLEEVEHTGRAVPLQVLGALRNGLPDSVVQDQQLAAWAEHAAHLAQHDCLVPHIQVHQSTTHDSNIKAILGVVELAGRDSKLGHRLKRHSITLVARTVHMAATSDCAELAAERDAMPVCLRTLVGQMQDSPSQPASYIQSTASSFDGISSSDANLV